jgi:hypothetical protein
MTDVDYLKHYKIVPLTIGTTAYDRLEDLADSDENSVAEQIRKAVDLYLSQPDEADKSLQVRQAQKLIRAEPHYHAKVLIPIEQIAVLGELASIYTVEVGTHIGAAILSYCVHRVADLPQLG